MPDLDFSINYILEDDRVKLIPLKVEHVKSLLDISEEPNLWTYFLEKGNGIEKLKKYVLKTINKRNFKQEYPFIIFDKLKNRYAGTTRFYEYSSDLKTIKLGHTWFGNEHRGTGLNKHCKFVLFQFAFETLQLERIGFGVHIRNEVSIAAMKSVGCKEEGVLRNYIPDLKGNGRADIILLSILKNEWFDKVKTELKHKLTNIKN